MTTKKYAPKLPLQLDDNGNFIKIDDTLTNVKQKLRMILLTSPGEKIMDPEFGVGVRKYLFEPTNGMINYVTSNGKVVNIEIIDFKNDLSNLIKSQVAKYANDIVINKVDINAEEQILNISIEYNYKGIFSDTLLIQS